MGTLQLNVRDVYGDFVGEEVEISVFNQRLASDRHRFRAVATNTLPLQGLRDATDNLYTLQIDAPSYLPVQRFVNVTPNKEINITLPVDIGKVTGVKFPLFTELTADVRRILNSSTSVKGLENKKGEALFDGLAELPCAGLLNICAKCRKTGAGPRKNVLSHVTEIVDVRQDRIFARVPAGLREIVDGLDDIFDAAPGGLHSFEDFQLAGSWKTRDDVANLQVTFFTNGIDWVADIDIDDFNGFAHVFQVINNKFTGGTHPFNIQQMLIKAETDPAYKLKLQQASATAGS